MRKNSYKLNIDILMNILFYSNGNYSLQDISVMTNIKLDLLQSLSKTMLIIKILRIV